MEKNKAYQVSIFWPTRDVSFKTFATDIDEIDYKLANGKSFITIGEHFEKLIIAPQSYLYYTIILLTEIKNDKTE